MKKLFEQYHSESQEEACGFILDHLYIIRLKNIHPEPTEGFEIDPQDTLRYMDRITGVWHTHPNSTSVLSGEDKACIEMWPDWDHYVVGEDGCRHYRVKDGAVIDVDYLPR